VANGTTASCVAPGSKRLVDNGRAPNRGRLPEQPHGSALNPTRHLHTREVEASRWTPPEATASADWLPARAGNGAPVRRYMTK
jgi:hypothetical protein